MYNGCFEDRDDARLSVKQWLRSHCASDYTPNNLRRLISELAKSDSEPVDHLRIARRERGYGVLKGLVEFAREELSESLAEDSVRIRSAYSEITQALGMVPGRSSAAIRHLKSALDLLNGANSAIVASSVQRAAGAAELALAVLGAAPMRVAA